LARTEQLVFWLKAGLPGALGGAGWLKAVAGSQKAPAPQALSARTRSR
jgi:hypothetical protein